MSPQIELFGKDNIRVFANLEVKKVVLWPLSWLFRKCLWIAFGLKKPTFWVYLQLERWKVGEMALLVTSFRLRNDIVRVFSSYEDRRHDAAEVTSDDSYVS